MEEDDYSNGTSATTTTTTTSQKKRKVSPSAGTNTDINSKFAFFDELTDDLVLEIISKLGSSASCPAHFFNLLLSSKRMNELGFHPTVLKKVSPKIFTCSALNRWREVMKLMGKCVAAGNLEAIYTVGMIGFYLFGVRDGKTLIEVAAALKNPAANHSLAVIKINESAATGGDADVSSAIENALTAASLGHVDATLELGYLFMDGYGVPRDVEEGRRLILQAYAREIFSALSDGVVVDANGAGTDRIPLPVPRTRLASGRWLTWVPRGPNLLGPVSESDLTIDSNFGWDVPDPEPHPANYFLTEWFLIGDPDPGLRSCYREGCGRPETRRDEFIVCPVCEDDCYCSRACQTMDWKRRHYQDCNGEYDNEEENFEDDIVVDAIQEEEVDDEGDLQENEEQI